MKDPLIESNYQINRVNENNQAHLGPDHEMKGYYSI